MGHVGAVSLDTAYRESVSIVSLVKSDIASITSSSPNRAHLSTSCDAMSCISVNSQVLVIRMSGKQLTSSECLTREHLLDSHRAECWDEDPVSWAPKPVVMVRSEYAFGRDIFQLSDCGGWEFDKVPARTEFVCQLIPLDKDFVIAREAELADGT